MANVRHVVLTGVNLHEPKGVALADAGEVYVANGSGSGAWSPQLQYKFVPKYISGLSYENAVDTANDIIINPGSCRDLADTVDIKFPNAMTKQLDADWEAGNAKGGLDTGTASTTGNTTYHIYVISNNDSTLVDGLFSLAPSAPTMPAGYTKRRRIGSIVRKTGVNEGITTLETDGGGLEVLLKTPNLDVITAIPTSAAVVDTLVSIPTGVKFNSLLVVSINGADVGIYYSSLDQADVAGYNTISIGTGAAASISVPVSIRTNTLAQIRARTSAPGFVRNIQVYGWIDHRRA